MSLPDVAKGGQHIAAHNAERHAINDLLDALATGYVPHLNRVVPTGGTYTANPFELIALDPSAFSRVVRLPDHPADKTQIAVKLIQPIASGSTVTITCQGVDVFNRTAGSTTMSFYISGQGALYEYDAATNIWMVEEYFPPITRLDQRYLHSVSVLAPARKVLDETPASFKIALVGDSTRDSTAAGLQFHNALKLRIGGMDYLEGMVDANVLNFGVNGATIEAVVIDAKMSALTAAVPSIIEIGWGTNNVRTSPTPSVSTLMASIVYGVERVRTACPGVPIILSIPGPFLTTDVGGAGYVSPNSEAQLKSSNLRAAFLRLEDKWSDVIVRDCASAYGTVSQAASTSMGDQIHPTITGASRSVDELVQLIGRLTPVAQEARDDARSTSPYTPWTVYGREVEDPTRYLLLGSGAYSASATSSYIDFTWSYAISSKLVRQGDLCELPDGQTFQIPNSGTSTPGADNTRILASAVPAFTGTSGRGLVRVWRRSTPITLGTKAAAFDSSSRTRAICTVAQAVTTSGSVGSRFITLLAASLTRDVDVRTADELRNLIAPGDQVYIDGMGVIDAAEFFTIGSTATLGGHVSNQLTLYNMTQLDRSSLVGRLAVIIGAHPTPSTRPINLVATSGATQTIPDPASGVTLSTITLSANCTFTFGLAYAGKTFDLFLVQDGSGSRTVTWPGGIKWVGGTPSLSTTAGKVDGFRFICYTDGTWFGQTLGLNA